MDTRIRLIALIFIVVPLKAYPTDAKCRAVIAQIFKDRQYAPARYDEELSRLDAHLAKYLSERLSAMTPLKRDNLLRLLNRVEPTHLDVGTDNVHFGMIDTPDLFSLEFLKNNIQLELNPVMAKHPVSRIALVHEFDHATRLISPRSERGSFSAIFKWRMGFNELIREEERAFAAQYDFIRRVYSEKTIPPLPQFDASELSMLTETGFLKKAGDAGYVFNGDRVLRVSSEEWENHSELVSRVLDIWLHQEVKSAMKTSRQEFVRMAARNEEYLKKQKVLHQDALRRWIVYGVAPAGYAGYGTYLLWGNPKPRDEPAAVPSTQRLPSK